jgi:phthalate 4,5-cis-dihydrodiol dehydrogenase
MIATCELADLRPSPTGVLVYGHDGMREVAPDTGSSPYRLSSTTIDELLDAIAGRTPVLRSARWGRDTLRVCLAVLESTKTGKQVLLDRAS